MPTYTVELWRAIELSDGDIGLDKYPIFDENYREQLNSKIVDHYYNQEIGMETISAFRLALSRRMNEIMPYFNQLYESQKIDIEPIFSLDITSQSATTTNTETVGESESTNSNTAKSRAINSEFPQNRLSGNEDYATSGSDSASEADGSAQGNQSEQASAETESNGRTYGTQGSQSDMLTRYRETFLNVDLAVINSLQDLFMLVWNTADDYTGRNLMR